jgi:hypothetical protein
MKSILATSLLVGLLGAAPAAAQSSSDLESPGSDAAEPGPIEYVADVPDRDVAAGSDRPAASLSNPTEATSRSTRRGNPLSLISRDSLRATRERPLFSESRRPPPAAVAVAAPPPPRPSEPPPEPVGTEPEPPKITLVGTAVGADAQVAVFLVPSARSVVRLRIGEAEESGWTLRSVDSKTTVLEKDSHEVTLSLPTPKSGSGSNPEDGVDPIVEPRFRPPSPNLASSRQRPSFKGRMPAMAPPRARPPTVGREF